MSEENIVLGQENEEEEFSSSFDDSSEKKTKSKKLIKLSKTKVVTISVMVFALAIGMSVGIYFAVVSGQPIITRKKYEDEVGVEWVSDTSDARKEINSNTKDGQITGLFIGSDNDMLTDLLLYDISGDDKETRKEQEELNGVFTEYLIYESTIDWIGIDYNNNFDIQDETDDLFIKNYDDDNPYDGYEFYDESFYYIGEPSNEWSDNANESEYYTKINVIPKISNGDDKDPDYEVDFIATEEDATIGNGSKPPAANGESLFQPTWMWFYEGDLVFVAQGAPTEDESDDGSGEIVINDNDLNSEFFVQVEKFIEDNNGIPPTEI